MEVKINIFQSNCSFLKLEVNCQFKNYHMSRNLNTKKQIKKWKNEKMKNDEVNQ